MKRIYSIPFITAIILGFLTTSCEKEVPLDEAIIGRFEVLTYKYTRYENNVKDREVTVFMESEEKEIQFAEGGAGLMYSFGLLTGNFSWSLNGSTMTAEFSDGSLTWDIAVDDDTLTWAFDESGVEDDVPVKYEVIYTAFRIS